MIVLRRWAGRRSMSRHTAPPLSGSRRGRSMPRKAASRARMTVKTSESMRIQSTPGSGVCQGEPSQPASSPTSQKSRALMTTTASPRLRRTRRPEMASRNGRTAALTTANSKPTCSTPSGMISNGMLVGSPSAPAAGRRIRPSKARVAITAMVLTRTWMRKSRAVPPGRVESRTNAPMSHPIANTMAIATKIRSPIARHSARSSGERPPLQPSTTAVRTKTRTTTVHSRRTQAVPRILLLIARSRSGAARWAVSRPRGPADRFAPGDRHRPPGSAAAC
jgi:hypothetical protein